jgi:hypothetical protein
MKRIEAINTWIRSYAATNGHLRSSAGAAQRSG